MTTIDLHGYTETLKPEFAHFSNEFKLAEEVFKETYELFNDPGYNSKTGWKLDKESATTGKVYTKPYKNGVIFALSASVAYTADTIFKTTVTEFEKIPTWNANVTHAEVIARISDNVDIFRYANPDILLVKSRDFVAVQANRKIGDTIYIAARSVDIDQAKESKKHVRGRINLGCSRISADGPNAKIEYLLAIDFGGSVPTSIVNKALSHIIMKDFKELQKHLDATH